MENKEFKVEDKHTYSIISILFFAPIVYFIVKNYDDQDNKINDEDKDFINWYIKYWLAIDMLIIVSVILYFMFYYSRTIPYLVKSIADLLIIISLTMIVVWFFMIFSNKKILNKKVDIKYKKIKVDSVDMIFNYLPIYNLIQRYKEPDIKSYRWLKESIILWSFWSIITFISLNQFLSLLILLVIILRSISLSVGIDIIPDKIKEKIDVIFSKNPEEIFWYIKWFIIFFIEKIKDKNTSWNKLIEEINNSKKEYENIVEINYNNKKSVAENKNLLIQYLILFIILWFTLVDLINSIKYSLYFNLFIAAFTLILFRYIYVVISRKYIKIPILNEVVLWTEKLIGFINKK